jgi:hypothetical protein
MLLGDCGIDVGRGLSEKGGLAKRIAAFDSAGAAACRGCSAVAAGSPIGPSAAFRVKTIVAGLSAITAGAGTAVVLDVHEGGSRAHEKSSYRRRRSDGNTKNQ